MTNVLARMTLFNTLLTSVNALLNLLNNIGTESKELLDKIAEVRETYKELAGGTISTWADKSDYPVLAIPAGGSRTDSNVIILANFLIETRALRGDEVANLLERSLDPAIRNKINYYLEGFIYNREITMIRGLGAIFNLFRTPNENKLLKTMAFIASRMLQARDSIYGDSLTTVELIKKLASDFGSLDKFEIPMLDIKELMQLSGDTDNWYSNLEGGNENTTGAETAEEAGFFAKILNSMKAWIESSSDSVHNIIANKISDLEVIERRKGNDLMELMKNYIIVPNLKEESQLYANVLSKTYDDINI